MSETRKVATIDTAVNTEDLTDAEKALLKRSLKRIDANNAYFCSVDGIVNGIATVRTRYRHQETLKIDLRTGQTVSERGPE